MVNGGIDKVNVLFNSGFIVICQCVYYVVFQLCGVVYYIFIGDDIQWGIYVLCFMFCQFFSDGWSDMFKYNWVYGSGD